MAGLAERLAAEHSRAQQLAHEAEANLPEDSPVRVTDHHDVNAEYSLLIDRGQHPNGSDHDAGRTDVLPRERLQGDEAGRGREVVWGPKRPLAEAASYRAGSRQRPCYHTD